MSSYLEFKTAQWLSTDELRHAVTRLLLEEPATAAHGKVILKSTVDSLAREGIGVVDEPPHGRAVGYRQVLSLTTAALLKLNGANLQAIKTEIAGRDDIRLEGLVNAVLTRMRGSLEPGASAPPASHGAGSAGPPASSAVSQPFARDGRVQAPELASQPRRPRFDPHTGQPVDRFVTADEPVAPSGGGAPVERQPGRESTGDHAGVDAATRWMRLAILDGFEVHLRSDVYERMVSTRRSDDLLRAFREQLDGINGTRR